MINLTHVKLHHQMIEEQCCNTGSFVNAYKSKSVLSQLRRRIGKGLVKIGDAMQKN